MQKYTFDLNGSPAVFEFKKLTQLCNSSVYATWGNTAVNVSVIRGKAKEGQNFFPLQVEYIEKWYASGTVASSPYVKREGFPPENSILRGRMIDRAIRPRFPKELLDEVQIFIHVLAYDPTHDPLILGFNATVAAVMASDIPFEGNLAGLRISLDANNQPYSNSVDVAGLSEMKKGQASMNMVIAVDSEGVVMFDADMQEVPEEVAIAAVNKAKEEANAVYKAQTEFAQMIGAAKKEGTMFTIPEQLYNDIVESYGDEIKVSIQQKEKEKRRDLQTAITDKIVEKYKEDETITGFLIEETLAKAMKKFVLHDVLEDGKRMDGRKFDEIRTLSAEVGIIPRLHGTGFFKRGDTHVLSIATLAAPTRKQSREDMTGEDDRYYIHEYSAPPASYGETGRYNAQPGRREIGHGALAEKAVARMLPTQEEFPYMIRVVSEVVSSAGSTSMASTCGSTLALMDAGVPLKKPVAGISIGVIADDAFKKHQLLTDIEEIEDFFGYMDFKVAGTRDGITAIQMDEKKLRIPYEVIFEAFEAARVARMQILDLITSVIAMPRASVGEFAPKIDTISIDPGNIGKLIGPSGKTIKEITKLSGMEINIHEDGKVEIIGVGAEARAKAKQMIEDLFFDFRVGETYDAEVIGIKPFGAIVRMTRGMVEEEGLVHVSELADKFVKDVNEIVKIGDKTKVKVVGIDDNGRLRLSIKQVQ